MANPTPKTLMNGPPVAAADRLWSADRHIGTLYALDPATGNTFAECTTGPLPRIATPAVANSTLVIGTTSGPKFFRLP